MKTYIIGKEEVIKEFMHHGVAGVKKLRKPFMLHEGREGVMDAATNYGGEFKPLTKEEAIELNNLYDDTRYEGSYIDIRKGMRYHIRFTYQLKDGEMVNENEIEAKELGRAL